jgi:hypothetical protein
LSASGWFVVHTLYIAASNATWVLAAWQGMYSVQWMDLLQLQLHVG